MSHINSEVTKILNEINTQADYNFVAKYNPDLVVCPNCKNQFQNKMPRYFSKDKELVCSEKCCIERSKKENSPLEIVIKPEALDISNVKEGEGNKNLYRPSSFDEYIGQSEAKERVNTYIKGCKEFNEQFPHTFLSAPSGYGKTTFALILTNILNKKFVTCTAQDIKSEQSMVDKIVECEGGIIFLDEAHKISTKIGTFLLPILEDYQIQGKKIKPFTMIFATTHSGNISKNLEALKQRFQLQIHLKHYSNNELISILKQYNQKKYQNIKIKEDIFLSIAKNCRLTPRLGLNLLREYIYTQDLVKVLKTNQIVKDGITENDIKVMKYLLSTNGAGKASISKFLRIEPNTYEFEVESFLIFKEFVTIGSKRKITDLGKGFLQCLN